MEELNLYSQDTNREISNGSIFHSLLTTSHHNFYFTSTKSVKNDDLSSIGAGGAEEQDSKSGKSTHPLNKNDDEDGAI